MAITVQIDGVGKVQLDDSFKDLSPEQQQSTVDEIANHPAAQASSAAAPQASSNFDLKTLKDVAKSGLSGLGQGVAGLAGLPGDISNAMTSGLTGLANRVTGANVQLPKSPLSGDVLSQKLSNAVGGYHEPQTVAGEYARTIGQFAPGMVAGPEGIIPRVASAVVPAVASEAAGQATKGTTLEPAARIAGALLAPVGVGLVKRTGASIANALSKTAPASVVDEVAGTLSDLKTTGSNLFDSVFKDPNKNVIISKEALSGLAEKVQSIAAEHGYKPSLNSKATVVINDVLALPKDNSTLMGLEMSKRVAGNVAKDRLTSDGALAGKIHTAITDFMDNLGDKDIVGTEANSAASNPSTKNALAISGTQEPSIGADLSGPSILKEARSTWRTFKKSAIIQNIQDNAALSATSTDKALQSGFRTLAKNSKKMAQFSPQEQAAIKLAATGSGVQKALSIAGGLAVRGPISAAVTTGLGHVLGPYGPYVLAGVGEAAKQGAASSTEANVNALSALVRGGPGAAQKLQDIRTAKMLQMLKSYSAPAAGVIGYAAQPALAGNQ